MKTSNTVQDLQLITIDELQRLSIAKKAHAECKGICYNLTYILKHLVDGYDIVKELGMGWEHHTGIPVWPVPLIENKRQWENDFVEGWCQWEGEEGKLRRALCAYLAVKVAELTPYQFREYCHE